MHPELLKRLYAGCVLLGALGCGSHESPGSARLAVIGGEATGTERESVLYVTAEVRRFEGLPVLKSGSGTLVAPNLLVTALHVISASPSDVPFTCDASGNEIGGGKGGALGPPVPAANVAVHAGPVAGAEPTAIGQLVVSSQSSTICQNDIAFIVLDRELDLMTSPLHRGAPAAVGDRVSVVGFGGGSEDLAAPPLRTEREVDVTAVGQWIRTFTVGEGPCEGDSGGPALAQSGELVGVFSTVASGCRGVTAAAKYTDISFFSSLAEKAFAAAGQGSPWPVTPEPGSAGMPAVEPAEPPPRELAESSCAFGGLAGDGRSLPSSSVALAAMLLLLARRVVARGRG